MKKLKKIFLNLIVLVSIIFSTSPNLTFAEEIKPTQSDQTPVFVKFIRKEKPKQEIKKQNTKKENTKKENTKKENV